MVLTTLLAIPIFAGNPSADGDCDEPILNPGYGLESGTRAEIYGCKSIGNSGEEQGVYTITTPDATHGDCTILVKWSGDYGGTPYLDFGTVFNNMKCTDGYVEIWGDRFDDRAGSTFDQYSTTPYVFSIGGQGSQIHP